jgi:hypothetical protein
MPRTPKQKKAACTAYGIKKGGGTPKVMANMSLKKLRQWCKGPLHKNDIALKSPVLREQWTGSSFLKKLNDRLKGV